MTTPPYASVVDGSEALADTVHTGLPAYRGTEHREIVRLAHVELAVGDIDVAGEFYVNLLGLQVADRSDDTLHLRAPGEFDRWSLKLRRHHAGRGLVHLALRVERDADLVKLADRHASCDIPHRWLEPGAQLGQGRALQVEAPGGHVVEFVADIEEIPLILEGEVRLPGRRGPHTGVAPVRLDHVNLRTPSFDTALRYWIELLGFSVSEYRADEGGSVDMAWLRRTTSSHDVALGRAPRPGVHHVAFAVDGRGALSHAADALADVGMRGQIEFGPGRHGTTDAYFIYLKDPFDNRVELYYGDYHRDLDRPPVRWSTDEYDRRGRLWWGQAPPPSFAEAAPLVAPARPR